MKCGDIIEFKRKGFVSWFLGGLLKLLKRDWDSWGWHLGIAWQRSWYGWYILEATGKGICLNWYSDAYLAQSTRVWEWFDEELDPMDMSSFLKKHINKKYDVAIYFWTSLAVIIRHYFNHPIPKLLDDRFSCWELVQEFSTEMGKPIISRYNVVVIIDIIKALKDG